MVTKVRLLIILLSVLLSFIWSETAEAGVPVWETLGLTGYTDRLSVQPGETVRFMVSAEEAEYRSDIVRLIHGDVNPAGPGFKIEVIDTPLSGVYPGRRQELRVGSYGIVQDSLALHPTESFTIQAWIYATTPEKGLQGIITKWSPEERNGYGLFVGEDGSLNFWIGAEGGTVERLSTGVPLERSSWYFVAAVFDADQGDMTLYQLPARNWPIGNTAVETSRATGLRSVARNSVPLLIAAMWGSAEGMRTENPDNHFNGKIDAPTLLSRALDPAEIAELWKAESPLDTGLPLIAAWDFSVGISSRQIQDISPNGLSGRTVNMPMRAVTGHLWSGKETSFLHAPEEYGAIHFHDDELEDAGWEVDFEFQIPSEFPSGIYAARLQSESYEDYIPFFVRPKQGTTGARIAYLLPTLTYLAYANFGTGIPGLLGLYDHHSDGSGVAYASQLMPLLELRPKVKREKSAEGKPFSRHLAADLYMIDWLEAQGYSYDILTDEDLAREGAELLAPYNVVITGSHPEYTTLSMLKALERYLVEGGRLMYLGGNGFYWVTSQDPIHSHVIEIRRWGGTQVWEAEPGEYHHSTTGELGGLWRFRGWPPQKLVGVGFTAQGWTKEDYCGLNRPYRRQPDSFDPRAAFIFEGLGSEELISDFESLGLGRGAAGDEIDRMDFSLGTPSHALLLASATGFPDDYQHVVEEILSMDATRTEPGNPLVRSDIVFFEYPNGGAVFSVGSISWFGSLSYNNYQNDVSRMTDNVLRTFASGDPLPKE